MDEEYAKQQHAAMGGSLRAQAVPSGLGQGSPMKEKQLTHLLGIIENTTCRYRDAINRYGYMNDGITGHSPEVACNGTEESAPSGLLNEIIEKMANLHSLCDRLDNENNRLNKIIIDG